MKPTGAGNSSSHAERMTPSDYLKLRKAESGWSRPIVVADRLAAIRQNETDLRHRGLDFDLLEAVLSAHRVDPETSTFGAMSFEASIDKVSLELIEIIAADVKTKQTQAAASARRGHVLADSIVNEIVLALLECNQEMPCGLTSLVQMRLDPKLVAPVPRKSTEVQRARALVAVALNPKVTTRDLAKIAQINQSTAARWKADEAFMREAESINVRR